MGVLEHSIVQGVYQICSWSTFTALKGGMTKRDERERDTQRWYNQVRSRESCPAQINTAVLNQRASTPTLSLSSDYHRPCLLPSLPPLLHLAIHPSSIIHRTIHQSIIHPPACWLIQPSIPSLMAGRTLQIERAVPICTTSDSHLFSPHRIPSPVI